MNVSGEGERKQPPTIPKEAQVIVTILRDLGIQDYEPGVLTQLVEFSYRYVTKVLEDAKVYSGHARKRAVDIEDIRLAVQVLTEQNVTSPPTRDVLLELAQTKNDVPMPLPRSGAGLRLPPDRHCLTSTNYRLTASRGGTGQAASGGVRMVNGGSGSGASAVPTFQIQPMAPPTGAGSMPGGLAAPTGLNNLPAKRKWDE